MVYERTFPMSDGPLAPADAIASSTHFCVVASSASCKKTEAKQRVGGHTHYEDKHATETHHRQEQTYKKRGKHRRWITGGTIKGVREIKKKETADQM